MKKFNRCLLGICFALASLSATAEELINCFQGDGVGGGDNLGRAFIVDVYPGFSLDQVYLFFISNQAAEGVYQLTARSDTFDGEIIGVAEASYTFSGNGEPVPILFDFRRAAVANGQRVTFAFSQLSGPSTFFSIITAGNDPDCPIIETIGTTPPLSTPRTGRDGVTAIITGASEALTASMALLENPADGGDTSGVNTISGWVCDAERVEVEIDGTILVEAAYGTPRADTMDVCGDDNNGFGLLINYGVLGDGQHTIRLLADDIEVDSGTFTVTTLGSPFVTGLNGTFVLPGFPGAGQQVIIEWLQSQQGFVITDFTP